MRVPKHNEASLSTALDAGASGIIISHCESPAEVKEKLDEIYYGTSPVPPIVPFMKSTESRTC